MEKIRATLLTLMFTSSVLFSFTSAFSEGCDQKDDSSFDLLVISTKKYQNECHLFIDYKEKIGINADLITTEEILENFDGRDEPEKIKYCIKKVYDKSKIQSVLLIGDFIDIPVRYCYNNDGFRSLEPYFISDLYYADLYDDYGCFSSWNTNGDNLYGEWNGQHAEDHNISLTPEVSLGRLPCSNRFELKTMIDKITQYEKSLDFDKWFHRIVVAGGDTYSEAVGYNDKVFQFYEGEEQAKKVMNVMSEFQVTPLFASEGTLSTFSVFKSIWNGCGFLYLSGHGCPGSWCTHPPNSTEKVGNFPNLLIPLLRNKDKLPVCVVGACQNSKFDVRPLRIFQDPFLHGTWHNKCWSWKLTSSPFGGSIATLGCTGLSWQGIEFGGGGVNWLEIQFFKEYAKGCTNLGDIWKNTITKYVENFSINWNTPSGGISSLNAKTVQEWALFGDPTLTIKA